MKTGCIVVNGNMRDFEFHTQVISRCDFVIAADGAANELMKMGALPNCVIGDMDSIKKEVYEHFRAKGIQMLHYPRKKDKTDSELAIDWMLKEGYDSLIMLGCFGDRVDHMLGNIYLMYYALEQGAQMKIMDEKNCLFFIREGVQQIPAKTGDTVSFLNIGFASEGLCLEGFAYPLTDYRLVTGSTRCLSNEAIVDEPTVKLRKGLLMGMISNEREP